MTLTFILNIVDVGMVIIGFVLVADVSFSRIEHRGIFAHVYIA